MKQVRYNTAEHRKLYKEMVERYESIDRFEVIEPRVRLLSDLIYKSAQGVTIYSCEGHLKPNGEGDDSYVMMIARNRDAAMQLLEWFQSCSAYVVERMGWEGQPGIECDLAYLDDDTAYSCIVIRSPVFTNEDHFFRFWTAFTKRFRELSIHHAMVNPNNKVA